MTGTPSTTSAKGADNIGSSTVSGPGPASLAEWSKEPGRRIEWTRCSDQSGEKTRTSNGEMVPNFKKTRRSKLVGGWTNPFEKYARQIGSSSPGRDENKKYLKPPPRKIDGNSWEYCHHQDDLRIFGPSAFTAWIWRIWKKQNGSQNTADQKKSVIQTLIFRYLLKWPNSNSMECLLKFRIDSGPSIRGNDTTS